jgi:hypothetical protein
MLDLFYAVDGVMLALAIAAAVCAVALTRQRIMPSWVVPAPGVLASLAAIALLSYPDVRDLLQLEVWSIAAVGILAGAARGQFMRLDSDHNWRLVRLRWAYDWMWVALGVLLLAILSSPSRSGCASRTRSRPRSSCRWCWPAATCWALHSSPGSAPAR